MSSEFLQVAVGVIKNTCGQILISKRDDALHQGGLWEFPGGKIEKNETPLQALARELEEELEIKINSATPLITIKHHYPEIAVQLNVFLVEQFSGVARSCLGQENLWVEADELPHYSFPIANLPIITAARLPPCYAILNEAHEAQMLINLHKILNKNIKLVQARLKHLSSTAIQSFISQAYPLCKQRGALLLINSDLSVKLVSGNEISVDGIHLSSKQLMALDSSPVFFSGRKQHKLIVAASCHNLDELQHAQMCGVDFVALSPVLATKTHPQAIPLGWVQFSELVNKINLPVYALGGLSETELMIAQRAGAQGIAAIRAFLA